MQVSIQVRSTDALKDQIAGELARQLQQIRGVRVAEEDCDFILSLIATELKSRDGRSQGIALSWVVLHPLHPADLDRLIEPSKRAYAKLVLADYHQFCQQRQVLWGDRDIRKLASYIVDDFETSFIDPARAKAAAG